MASKHNIGVSRSLFALSFMFGARNMHNSYCYTRHFARMLKLQPTTSARSLHVFTMPLLSRDGTALEKLEEQRRKATEMQLFKDLAAATKTKSKETFLKAIEIYEKEQSVYRRGHVDFILGAIDQMKDFSVHKDVEVYKALMKVFPAGTMVARNQIQAEFMHYPKQQDAGIQILTAMSNAGCIPDDQMGDIIISRFGKTSFVMKRYQRMMYWMPKFRSINPYPIPWMLPESVEELAVLALKRMAVDKCNEVKVYQTSELESCQDETFVASAISPAQRELLAKHPVETPLFVEGGYMVWLRDKHLFYFVLRADPRPEVLAYNVQPQLFEQEVETGGFTSHIDPDYEDRKSNKKTALLAEPSMHEQPEGTIMAMCITGTSSKDSLVSWINLLQKENPTLSRVPIVFSLRTPESGLQSMEDDFSSTSEPAAIQSGHSPQH